MKRLTLISIIIALAVLAFGQTVKVVEPLPDTAIEPLMQYRMYNCFEVEYNAILLAPRLYKENSADSLSALLKFWKAHCTVNERLFSIILLNNIRNKTFSESLSENEFLLPRSKYSFDGKDIYGEEILAYLGEYRKACRGNLSQANYSEWLQEGYPMPKDNVAYYEFYKTYYLFLKQMAASMIGKREYTPIEDFLLRFYAHPDSTGYTELDSVIYAGTILNKHYRAYRKFNEDIHGLSSNLHGGMWVPTGNLAILGSHPYFTYAIGGRTENIMVDALIGFRMGAAPATYQVQRYDSVYNSQNFLSWYTGLDFGCKLWRTKKSEIDLLWGVGYEELQVLSVSFENENVSTSNNSITKSLKSFYANTGIGYRFYVRNTVTKNNRHVRNYFSLQAKYNYVNYNNEGGTDLRGNNITIGLVYGVYSNAFKKY